MITPLRRITGAEDLALTEAHEAIARPRRGKIAWEDFSPEEFAPEVLDRAANAWRARALQEMHSLALFTQLASQLHLLGAPLDWSGAFARMIADEVRHTDLCLRFCERLGRPAHVALPTEDLHLHASEGTPLREHVRQVVIAAFCIGETLSGRMFKRALRAATVPLARDVVRAIVIDETFHGELGWELGALLMREDADVPRERAALNASLPALVRHFAGLCLARAAPAWARGEPEFEPSPNFGTLTAAGYARAFFDGMEEDVVPGLVSIGLVEAEPAYRDLLAGLPARP